MTLIHTNMQIFPHCVDSGFSSCLIYGLGFQSGASIGGGGVSNFTQYMNVL